jgi:hypothetical protein
MDSALFIPGPRFCYSVSCFSKDRAFWVGTPGRHIMTCPYHLIDAVMVLPEGPVEPQRKIKQSDRRTICKRLEEFLCDPPSSPPRYYPSAYSAQDAHPARPAPSPRHHLLDDPLRDEFSIASTNRVPTKARTPRWPPYSVPKTSRL